MLGEDTREVVVHAFARRAHVRLLFLRGAALWPDDRFLELQEDRKVVGGEAEEVDEDMRG